MAKIDNLKTLLHQAISDGNYKLPCYVNETNAPEVSRIVLYYNGVNDTLAISGLSSNAYYSQGVQVAIRHKDYNQSRTVAFTAHKYVKLHDKDSAGFYFILASTPVYVGMDEKTGGYVWAFDVQIKGAE